MNEKRGSRAGSLARSRQLSTSVYKRNPDSKSEHIPIVPSGRLPQRQVELPSGRILIKIKLAAFVLLVKIGVLNIQCLKKKSTVVLDLNVSKAQDVFALVESWDDWAVMLSIIASTPPGYRVIERARPRSKSRLAVYINYAGIHVLCG